MLLALYTLAMFVSATLLFLIQPMFARMILPLLGGSPAVWNTAVVFYQTTLLVGYIAAHFIISRLTLRRQTMLYLVLLVLPLLVLPVSVPAGWTPPTETSPVPWLLALLLVAVGLPFFVVSTSSPVLQSWFGNTDHPAAHDPYFLYAASNVGSILGLLVYPLVLEQYLRLNTQSWLWATGYGFYAVLMLGCAAMVWRNTTRRPTPQTDTSVPQPALVPGDASDTVSPPSATITPLRRLRWVLWTMAPASLMLSVTTYLSTNIAAIPLFWVVPLVLYLLTFVIVFSRKPLIPHWIMARALPIVLLPLVVVLIAQATDPIEILFPLHLFAFFIITMACHGALAQDRPPKEHLTEFYMWVSIGGALGGMFNALLAPLIFTNVLEYPLMLVVVALLPMHTARTPSSPQSRKRDLLFPLALGILTALLIVGVQSSEITSSPVRLALMFVAPVLLCFSFSRRPLRFGLGVGALVLVGSVAYAPYRAEIINMERSFFGVHKVLYDDEENRHILVHGSTLHGVQSLDPSLQQKPLSYYYPTGPIGQVFAEMNKDERLHRVASVGLGVGSLACYSQPEQEWTFYEIDPFVKKIASDTFYFTYLQECAPDAPVILGDGRLSLMQAPDHRYDLIVLDAYSSDAIPLHLITREALDLYLDKLAPGGIIAFHISNRYVDLKPVLANLAHDAGLAVLYQDDNLISAQEEAEGKQVSVWVILARSTDDFGELTADSRWEPLEPSPDLDVWTDDFASLFSVLRW